MHTHKIVEIYKSSMRHLFHLSFIKMDCPVSPDKIMVTTRELTTGETFDPHFTNKIVVARFPPNYIGWENAEFFIDPF